jgi:cystathionine gamma-synthase
MGDNPSNRADNPTCEYAERLLASREGGCGCALFASGMAASIAVTWGLDVEFVDTSDLSAVDHAIRPGRTRLLWIETPSNPTWEITDLAAISSIAHAANIRVMVDNTVSTAQTPGVRMALAE